MSRTLVTGAAGNVASRLGRVEPTPTVSTLLGRAPTSFESFAQANASAFR
jgi:hypothetical protein